MRFMVIVKANKDTEAGKLPSAELLESMGKFNEELVKAGVLLAAEGLQASSKGARVKFSADNKTRTVTDGPFAETKELIAGFWLWKCKDPARGDRLGEAHPVLDGRRAGGGSRNSPGVRGGRFRRRIHAGTARAGRAAAGSSGRPISQVVLDHRRRRGLERFIMQKITPFLWFNGRAKEAVDFYSSVFKNSKTISVTPLPPNPPAMETSSPRSRSRDRNSSCSMAGRNSTSLPRFRLW